MFFKQLFEFAAHTCILSRYPDLIFELDEKLMLSLLNFCQYFAWATWKLITRFAPSCTSECVCVCVC